MAPVAVRTSAALPPAAPGPATTLVPPDGPRGRPLLLLAGVALMVCLVALALHPRAYALLGAILAAGAMGVVGPTLQVGGVRGEIRYRPSRGQVGRPLLIAVRLWNRWPWPAWGLVVDPGWSVPARRNVAGRGQAGLRLAVAYLPGWRETEIAWEVAPQVRGRFPVAGASISSGFPFGFRWARRRLESPGDVVVWPRAAEVPDVRAASAGQDQHGQDEGAYRAAASGEILGTRPYQPGDRLRSIHWRQTARHDRLIICEQGQGGGNAVEIVVGPPADGGLGAGTPPGTTEPLLERMVSLAAGLLQSAQAAGMPATLRLDRQEPQSVGQERGFQRAMDALALWQPDQGATFVLPPPVTRCATPRCVWAVLSRGTYEHLSPTQRGRADVQFILMAAEGEQAGTLRADPQSANVWRAACTPAGPVNRPA